MATFSAVNVGLTALNANDLPAKAPTPTPKTPTPNANDPEQIPQHVDKDDSLPNMPTRHSFGGMLGQRPLPEGPATAPETPEASKPVEQSATVKRDGAHRSVKDESQDVEMGDAGNDDQAAEDDGSDTESVNGDGTRSSKKKKGQRFFCTDFPPCQLSFTRSEHLARHIRKHTGERPFQCHCSRRFSRLDNLRQHAQTVHVNEDIPAESLAATSTRFQRQIRTDRVRPPTSRSRASTLSSSAGGPPHRGHSRNWSTSSIGSTTSSIGGDEHIRARPPPLAMANDAVARARLSLETSGGIGSPGQQYMYYNQSSSGYSTPTSTVFSNGPQSPRFSEMASPSSTLSRSSYYNGPRQSGRRLSVPSANPYHIQQPPSYSQAYFSPIPSGTSATFSQNGNAFGSPTSSVVSHGRRDSETETDWRRRTWHPSTTPHYAQRPATSGLTFQQTPDEPRPAFSQYQAASQMTRLPGIESFDHAPPPGIRQQQDTMMLDPSPRPTSSGRELQQGLTRLDITAANAPIEGQWQAQQAPPSQHPAYPRPHHQPPPPMQYGQPKYMSMPEPPVTPRRNKRDAWYGGPITPHGVVPGLPTPGQFVIQRPSPEDSGSSDGVPTPSTSQATEYNPVIVHNNDSNDYPPPGTAVTTDEQPKVYYNPSSHTQHKSDRVRTDSGYQTYNQPPAQPYPQQTYALHSDGESRLPPSTQPQQPINNMAKLEALVAVATSEGSRAEPRP